MLQLLAAALMVVSRPGCWWRQVVFPQLQGGPIDRQYSDSSSFPFTTKNFIDLPPHSGQNRCLLANLASQVGQDNFIRLLRCSTVVVAWSKSVSETFSARASDTRQPK